MSKSRLVKISKHLSYYLRHRPQELGLELMPGGWVSVEQLLAAFHARHFPLSQQDLETVVISNDKQRFSFDSTKTLIRANQGHTTPVDLQLQAVTPPDVLYHGTGAEAVKSILTQGLLKMSRHHVHLSLDLDTARKVAQRKGKPVIFQVNALTMYQNGYQFYRSDNGVWLVETVPPAYLVQLY